jgi:hypothetical protein
MKRRYIYSSISDSEAVRVIERNNADLKKLPQVLSEQTSDLSICLRKCHVSLKVRGMYSAVNRIFHFSYFDPDYLGFTVIP